MAQRSVVVLISSLFVTCVAACTYDQNDRRGHCKSFQELKKVGVQPEWIRLNVNNGGHEKFGQLAAGLFDGVRYIQDLQIKGLVNSIEPGALSALSVLFELHLDDNRLYEITPGNFSGLPVEKIYIHHCEVTDILPKAFENMHNLKVVDFYGNRIPKIRAGVFNNLDLTFLILRLNRIKYVEEGAFKNMKHLFRLSLEENELTSFEPQLTLSLTPSLRDLYINRNQLTKLTREMLSLTPGLFSLLANINHIQRFGDDVFHDLPLIELLDVSNNALEEVKTNAFPPNGLRNLKYLFLHDNKLSFLSSGVLVRLPRLSHLSVGGNAWQCPCWNLLDDYMHNHNITKLCYEEYTQGSRPFCVFSENHPKDCIFDVENNKDIPELFSSVLTEYPALPKVCNIWGPKPYLGS